MPLFLNGIERGSLFLAGNDRATAWKAGNLVFGNSGGGPTPELVRLTPAMTSNTTPAPFVVSASSSHVSEHPWKALDQGPSLWGSSDSGQNDINKWWWMVDLGSSRILKKIKLFYRADMVYQSGGQSPRDFTISTSLDGNIFENLLTEENAPKPSVVGQLIYESPDVIRQSRFIRINISRNWGVSNNTVCLGEVELYGY